MKKLLLYLLVFAVCVVFCEHRIDQVAQSSDQAGSSIRQAMLDSGAVLSMSRLDSWAQINRAASAAELDQMMEGALDCLGLLPVEIDSRDLAQSAVREYQHEKGLGQVQLTIRADYPADITFISFIYIDNGATGDLNGWVRKMEQGGEWDWHHYYLYSANLTESAQNTKGGELLQNVMSHLGGQTKEVFSDGTTCSQTGYAKGLNEMVTPVWVENRKVNVQLALSPSGQKRVLLIGIPLILGEY